MSLIQNDLFTENAQEVLADRKRWHNLEAALGGVARFCKSCHEPLGSKSVVDGRLDSIEEVDVCINPACSKFGRDLL